MKRESSVHGKPNQIGKKWQYFPPCRAEMQSDIPIYQRGECNQWVPKSRFLRLAG